MTISDKKARRNTSHWLLLALSFFLCSAAVCSEGLADEANPGKHTRSSGFNNRASELAMYAMGLLGIDYKRGGNLPEDGLDCSGLVRYVYKEAWGTTLPRTSLEISRLGQHIKTHDLQPGDLVFFNTLKRGFSHVGIYLGESKFIHSPSTGGQVRIESMEVRYWKKRFNGARRIHDPEQKTATLPAASIASIASTIEQVEQAP